MLLLVGMCLCEKGVGEGVKMVYVPKGHGEVTAAHIFSL
jgi:hypothetical protein